MPASLHSGRACGVSNGDRGRSFFRSWSWQNPASVSQRCAVNSGADGEWTKPEDILAWGRVSDKSFCQEKKLFRFYGSTPPRRAVDVYTDANDVIVYATWVGL